MVHFRCIVGGTKMRVKRSHRTSRSTSRRPDIEATANLPPLRVRTERFGSWTYNSIAMVRERNWGLPLTAVRSLFGSTGTKQTPVASAGAWRIRTASSSTLGATVKPLVRAKRNSTWAGSVWVASESDGSISSKTKETLLLISAGFQPPLVCWNGICVGIWEVSWCGRVSLEQPLRSSCRGRSRGSAPAVTENPGANCHGRYDSETLASPLGEMTTRRRRHLHDTRWAASTLLVAASFTPCAACSTHNEVGGSPPGMCGIGSQARRGLRVEP